MANFDEEKEPQTNKWGWKHLLFPMAGAGFGAGITPVNGAPGVDEVTRERLFRLRQKIEAIEKRILAGSDKEEIAQLKSVRQSFQHSYNSFSQKLSALESEWAEERRKNPLQGYVD